MTGSLIETPTLGDRTIADDRTRHHAPRARMDGWWPAAARIALSSANLQTRGAQLRTALTGPPFSWIDHLIRPLQERRRDGQAKRLGGLEVDDQLEPRRPLDGQVAGLRTLENLVHVGSGAPKIISNVRSIGHKAPGIHTVPVWEHRRQPVLCREVHEASSLIEEHGAWQHSQSTRARLGHFREGPVEIVRPSRLNELKLHPQRACRDFCSLQHVLVRAFAELTGRPEDSDPIDPRNGLLELFQTLA